MYVYNNLYNTFYEKPMHTLIFFPFKCLLTFIPYNLRIIDGLIYGCTRTDKIMWSLSLNLIKHRRHYLTLQKIK